MTSTATVISHPDQITIDEWDALGIEAQRNLATYDDGELRDLCVIRATLSDGTTSTFTVCEELIDGRWESFTTKFVAAF